MHGKKKSILAWWEVRRGHVRHHAPASALTRIVDVLPPSKVISRSERAASTSSTSLSLLLRWFSDDMMDSLLMWYWKARHSPVNKGAPATWKPRAGHGKEILALMAQPMFVTGWWLCCWANATCGRAHAHVLYVLLHCSCFYHGKPKSLQNLTLKTMHNPLWTAQRVKQSVDISVLTIFFLGGALGADSCSCWGCFCILLQQGAPDHT